MYQKGYIMAKPKKEPHPTLFVLEGSVRWFKDGSMLELHAQITPEEWMLIVSETIKYQVFVECLKEVACPILEDNWTQEDEWGLLQMQIAVSRMRNIDPLLVAKFDREAIKTEYSKLMRENGALAKKELDAIQQMQAQILGQINDRNGKDTKVSDL
jgi:hypothetical protein